MAQTRLKKRSHRPDVEACNDPPHNRLVDEVSVIMDSILLLDQKITQAEVSFSFSTYYEKGSVHCNPFHVS